MGVEFAFQCSGVLQTDSPTWSNTYGIILCGRRGGRRNGLCERRGTHILALKHAWTQKWFVQILAAD